MVIRAVIRAPGRVRRAHRGSPAIAPSSAIAGNPDTQLVVYGSGYTNGAVVQWNTAALKTTYVSAGQLTATIPASDLAAVSQAQVTVTNSGAGAVAPSSNVKTFTIAAAPASTTWVRSVGIAPSDIAWDAVHGMIYASMPKTDGNSPNTIIAVNPVTGRAGTPVPSGSDPDLLLYLPMLCICG